MTYVFIAEIFISFNTSYFEEGELITSRVKIFHNYVFVTQKFWTDLFTTLIMFFNDYFPYSNTLQLLFLARNGQLFFILAYLEGEIQIQKKFNIIFELIKLVLLVVYVAHITCCIFHYIAIHEIQSGRTDTWLDAKELTDSSTFDRYINSFYYCLITMSTVGYGDISPTTTVEKLYIIFMTIICCGIFAHVINTIGNIFNDIALRKQEHQKKKYDIISYMNNRQINQNLQRKVIKQLEHQQQMEEDGLTRSDEVLKVLPISLNNEIRQQFYGKILKKIEILQFNFSNKFLDCISTQMKEQTFAPGQQIFTQNQVTNQLFFIYKGQIEFYKYNKNENKDTHSIVPLGNLGSGKMIGYTSFFSELPQSCSARSVNISQIASIQKECFLDTLKDFPLDYERFCALKDTINYINPFYGEVCRSCNSPGCSTQICPFLHYRVHKPLLISKYNKQEEVQDIEIQRKKRECNYRFECNSLKYITDVKEQLKFFRMQMILDLFEIQEDNYNFNYYDEIFNNMQEDPNLSDEKFFTLTPQVLLKDPLQQKLYKDKKDLDQSQQQDIPYYTLPLQDQFDNDLEIEQNDLALLQYQNNNNTGNQSETFNIYPTMVNNDTTGILKQKNHQKQNQGVIFQKKGITTSEIDINNIESEEELLLQKPVKMGNLTLQKHTSTKSFRQKQQQQQKKPQLSFVQEISKQETIEINPQNNQQIQQKSRLSNENCDDNIKFSSEQFAFKDEYEQNLIKIQSPKNFEFQNRVSGKFKQDIIDTTVPGPHKSPPVTERLKRKDHIIAKSSQNYEEELKDQYKKEQQNLSPVRLQKKSSAQKNNTYTNFFKQHGGLTSQEFMNLSPAPKKIYQQKNKNKMIDTNKQLANNYSPMSTQFTNSNINKKQNKQTSQLGIQFNGPDLNNYNNQNTNATRSSSFNPILYDSNQRNFIRKNTRLTTQTQTLLMQQQQQFIENEEIKFMKIDTDSMYLYKKYFPKNNYDIILEKFDIKQILKKKKIQQYKIDMQSGVNTAKSNKKTPKMNARKSQKIIQEMNVFENYLNDKKQI